MGSLWEIRKLIPDAAWSVGGSIRTVLPRSGSLSAIMYQATVTPVNDARVAIEKWRLIDYLSKLEVKVNGSTVIKSMSGRLAHVEQWLDGGPAITDQHHNYGTSTLRSHGVLNFGRYFKDLVFGLPLDRFDSVEFTVTNDLAAAQSTSVPALQVYGVFLRDAPAGHFPAFMQTEEIRNWTTVQAATEYVKLQEKGRLRRIVMQADPYCTTAANADTQIYNVLNNLRLTHRSGNIELYNGATRDLWFAHLYEDSRTLLQGAEPYHTDGYGIRTGLGQTLYKTGLHMSQDNSQSTYAVDLEPGNDSSTQKRQADADADTDSMLFMGLGLENTFVWPYDTYGDIDLCPDLAIEKDVELECKTADSSSAASGKIRVQTSRLMVP